MSSKPHLELFTLEPTPTDTNQLSSFTLFSKLPYEIRIAIWKSSLHVQRIIKIHVHWYMQYVANRAYNGLPVPPMERGKDDPAYYPVVQGYQVLSKLLRVTRESREAALAFYRVQVPCWLTHGLSKSDLWVPGELYYNPEYDFLHLQQNNVDIIEFMCKLKNIYDPRRIGLRNLALCGSLLGGRAQGLHTIDPSTISPESLRTFQQIINGLEEVWFVSIQRVGRQLIGYETGWPSIYKTFFERSVPITAMPPRFDRVGPDPRAIGNDLSHLHLLNPTYLYNSWRRVIERFEIEPSGIQHQFLFTFGPSRDQIYNSRDASNWLQKEDDIWTGKHKGDGPFSSLNLTKTPASETPAFKDENLELAVRPVIGFWIFPVDAFSDEYYSTTPDNEIKEVDVKGHWPDLAILRLDS
ncbi:uncharacterized protein FTOL_03832 [Fusarium torulosum]|uniref:2EXR domain-containing protein n=1 Tax=Fusarium torulosum TaxID=33205 RepID=A0AAE8SG55_9HYPO|nr:uncharacterized protein FTOL_03832 [Fusarium torulosum]